MTMEETNKRDAVLDLIEHGDTPELAPVPRGKFSDSLESSDDSKDSKRVRAPQKDSLIKIAEACDLWSDPNRIGYATILIKGHSEHWPIRSRDFKMWIASEYYSATRNAVGNAALDDVLRILEARAVNAGARHETFVRVGRANGKIYVDLADEDWRTVEVSRDGWQVISNSPVRFLRSPAMRPLPEPEAGYSIDELRCFANCSDDDFKLVVAWLVAALRDRGPYPLMLLTAEQGAGKSTFARMLRWLVDPAAAPIRSAPKDERDILVSASNSWVLAFDNLSSIAPWLSDSFCRLSTGGGFSVRANYTDRDEAIFESTRPLILNGIGTLVDRADLADRALTVHLRTIAEHQRRTEAVLLREFEQARPRILGALLDAVSAGLRNIDQVTLSTHPRLADFAEWIEAASPGLGWDPGSFLSVYDSNRRDVSEATFEADLVAVSIQKFITRPEFADGWRGSATELLAYLNQRVPEPTRRARRWPVNAGSMGTALQRVAPLLRGKGFVIDRVHSGTREITLLPPASVRAPVRTPMEDEVPI